MQFTFGIVIDHTMLPISKLLQLEKQVRDGKHLISPETAVLTDPGDLDEKVN
ncbi:MAG: hypothetical protein ACM3YE_01065 [Bacteroidota bacterium]